MTGLPPDRPHVLFLFSDTGGGHRSAAEAIIEAIDLEFPGQISTEMVDFFRRYAPPPLDLAPEFYPPLSRLPEAWELAFKLSDGRRRTRFMTNVFWPYVRSASHRLVEEHPSDLIVSVHPLANGPVLKALKENRPPYITVVTDLVSVHAFWYHRRADIVIVPTDAARQRALEFGLDPNRVRDIGLPVADRFCKPQGNRQELRARLGWPQDRPVIILVGGGEGMGPLERTAQAIASAHLNVALVIIAGRNQKLKIRLESQTWPMATFVYGFVRDMPDFFRAADILVTKAGPGTISESFIAGLPIILYSKVAGQEEGNVSFVVDHGAGLWAPEPDQITAALADWVDHPEKRHAAAEACKRLARPMAARQIARIIALQLGVRARKDNV